ncbi:hypothetical protein GCM10011383_27460 [Hymenobacter cavernae]|uniref:Uncharacterized protein n=2 Tax=Hymenobacter cavernae TaxID=2044852 RepID=A0ABQ1UF36_9BACT|nr:hypothetical protein GCM10011383_27460 [Hymenobacter cavernae]
MSGFVRWRKVLALSLLLLITQAIQVSAQVGGLIIAGVRSATMGAIATSGDLVSLGKGNYQLVDQSWHPAKMWLQGLEGGLQAQEEGSRQKRLFSLDEVQAVATVIDTFRVMRNFADPKKPDVKVPACFVKQVYNRGGYLLASYSWTTMNTPEWDGDGLLLSHGKQVITVPVKRKEFEQVMLSLFGDHPDLAKQLKAGALRAKQTKQIVAVYVNWKQQNH